MSARKDVFTRRMEEATGNLTASCANHVAELSTGEIGGEQVETLLWRQPGTGIHLMRFTTMGARLFVTGDLYCAIYCRAPGVRWWAGLGLHYFAEKCEASSHGREPVEWDGDEALARAREIIAERMRYKRDRTMWRRFKDCGGEAAAEGEHDWVEFCREYGNEFFGQDWWEIRFGRVVSIYTAYHLAGLKLAIAALDRQVSAATPDPRAPDEEIVP